MASAEFSSNQDERQMTEPRLQLANEKFSGAECCSATDHMIIRKRSTRVASSHPA